MNNALSDTLARDSGTLAMLAKVPPADSDKTLWRGPFKGRAQSVSVWVETLAVRLWQKSSAEHEPERPKLMSYKNDDGRELDDALDEDALRSDTDGFYEIEFMQKASKNAKTPEPTPAERAEFIAKLRLRKRRNRGRWFKA